MGAGKRLLHGAAWSYGGQIITVLAQFGYAAITTRLASADVFGDYAIALIVCSFAMILATGGIGQTVGRMLTLEGDALAKLYFFALILGIGAAIALAVAAPFLADMWNTPSAADAIAFAALIALISPVSGFLTGFERRVGRFASLSIVVLASNLAGFVIGALVLAHWRSAPGLLVSPLVALLVPVLYLTLRNARRITWRSALNFRREDLEMFGFSAKVTASRVLTFFNWNIGKYATTLAGGSQTLGQWNRADVVTGVPFTQVQNVVVQTTYPEFRHDRTDTRRARAVWADMVGLAAWLYWPLATVVAFVMPLFVPIIFGEGWGIATTMIPFLAFLAAIQGVMTIVGSALEATAQFKVIWSTQGAFLAIQLGAATLVLMTGRWEVAITSLIVAGAIQHSIHIIVLSRKGYLAWRVLVRHYVEAFLASATCGLLMLIVMNVSQHVNIAYGLPIVAAIAVAVLLLIIRMRNSLPPVRIARKHGILRPEGLL